MLAELRRETMGSKAVLKAVTEYIEENIEYKVTLERLSENVGFSEGYIKKLFSSAFGMTVSDYIRKRKLSLSAEKLLKTDLRISDISEEYGFEFPQSYINAFKREFGITPYRWKLAPSELELTEKIDTEQIMELSDGVILPKKVILPKLLLCGMKHTLGFDESHKKAPEAALEFWNGKRKSISDIKENGVYYGLTEGYDAVCRQSKYYCTVSVLRKNRGFENIYAGGGKYIKFTYIGEHSYSLLSTETARSMYCAVDEYFKNHSIKSADSYFERVDTNKCTDDFCVMEWYIKY